MSPDVSVTTSAISAPDLTETSVTDPPTSGDVGTTFAVTDTVSNQGSADAGASTTKYYLSLDKTKSPGDPALTGSRAVGAIAAGGTDNGSTMVTVGSMSAGTYYLLACADATNVVSESDETNNCLASAGTIAVGGADLVESAVGDPPASNIAGTPFQITDTVQNNGAVSAGSSTTYFYVSLDGIHVAAGTRAIGSRAVPSLAPGATSAGTTSVSIQSGTPDGSYHVLACADRLGTVAESNESNNCTASSGTVAVTSPDLTESNVSVGPSPVDARAMLSVTETTNNITMTAAGASTTRFYLSTDGTSYIGWIRACVIGDPIPGRDVPALAGATSSSGTSTFALCYHDKSTNSYGLIPVGTYYIIACADDTQQVSELSETNNCATSATTFQVTLCGNGILEPGEACDDGNTVSGDGCSSTCQLEAAPDLVETTVSDPPASSSAGGSFTVMDTVTNTSTGETAGASTTRYYLSLDTIKSPADYQMQGARAVPSLAAGASSAGSATVTLPAVPSGSYFLLACADADSVVPETNENNNCTASAAKVSIGGADLIESAVSDPPANALDGATFTANDTVENIGSGDAGSSITYYYVSLDGTHVAPGTIALGHRSVGAVAAGSSDSAMITLKVPAGTAAGTYYLLVCADRTYQVPEINENNNCSSSTNTMVLTGPDLTEGNVALAPNTVPTGTSVVVTDSVTNGTMTTAGSSITHYYISTDALKNAGDLLVRDCSTGADIKRSVPSLTSGASSTGSATLPLCYRDTSGLHSLSAGTYYILACADDGGAVPETNESNNCAASATTLTVTP